jgi:hypothetical protein
LAPALAFAQGLFPSLEAPLLGGSEWERRFSVELRVGLDSGALGGQAQFFWGPHATLEFEMLRSLDIGLGATRADASDAHWSLKLPFRLSLSDSAMWAPLVGYRENSPQVRRLALVGFETWIELGPVDLWFETATYVGESKLSGEWSIQLEKSFPVGRRVLSFAGLRYREELLSERETQGVYLAWGSRF